MDIRFACPSVPHNGHHILVNRIMVGYDHNSPMDYEAKAYPRSIVAGHFHINELQYWIDIINRYDAIIPLRHPARSLMSFRARRKPLDLWMHHWSTMIQFDGTYIDPLFVHIDDKEIRDAQVEAIHEKASIDKHQIDWSVNEFQTGSKFGLHDAVITDESLKDVPELFIRYYEKKAEPYKNGENGKRLCGMAI